MNAIRFDEVSLTLGERAVLRNVSLDIGAGDFVGVLGPNGSGKTTLLRAVLGLVPPTRGSIQVLGRPATRGNPAIGYMPQLRAHVAAMRLSGWDFVASAVNGQRLGLPLPSRASQAEIERALELVGARELGHHPLAEISGGERQRVLLAQALLGGPRLLLLDEPLTSLDPHYEQEVVALIKRLQQELGITVLFSAHELNPLLGAMDKVLYMGRGQATLGTVDAVVNGPVLSRLYGSEIDVVRVEGRIFVMAGGSDVERAAHRHEPIAADRRDPQRVSAGHA